MDNGTGALYVRVWGDGEPVVLLHGSVPPNREEMWAEARRVLAGRYRLLVPDRRGYGESPDGERGDLDTEVQDLLTLVGDGAHVVGFSYGGVIALLAAARRPQAIRSLTVIEPPTFAVARGHPEVDRIIAALTDLYAEAPRKTPEEFHLAFGRMWGSESTGLPVLTAAKRRAVSRMMDERDPAQIAVPVALLAEATFPKLVISGGTEEAFEILCDALAQQIHAARETVPDAGHTVRHPAISARIATFLASASV